MNIADFEVYRDVLRKNSGLVLGQDKTYIVESRLNPVAKKWGYDDLSNMTHALRAVPPKDLIMGIVEAMTVNETSFFRDRILFDGLKTIVLPNLKKASQSPRNLRIWSTAASSGQEPYSIAMVLREESGKMPGWSYDISATDISHEILDQAREGIYTQLEVQRGLPVEYLLKYFQLEKRKKKWTIHDSIKNLISFKQFNLLKDMKNLDEFDVIFCCNVLVYFDSETKKDVLRRLNDKLAPDGYLFLGSSEEMPDEIDAYKAVPEFSGLYQKCA